MLTISPRPASIIIGAASRAANAAARSPPGEHQIPVPPANVPERQRRVRRDLIPAPRVVHQHVQAALRGTDAVEHRRRLRVIDVITADRDTGPAAGGDLLGGVLNGARPARRGWLAPHTAAGQA